MTQLRSTTARPDVARPLLSALRAMGLGLGLLIGQASWASPVVSYVATDLVDTITGQDLWRYDYTITGLVDESLLLNFSFLKYLNLDASETYATTGMDVADGDAKLVVFLLASSDPVAMVAGLISVNQQDPLSAASPITMRVEFDWLGQGAPGSQGFQVFDVVGNSTEGATTPPGNGNVIPEPASLALMLAALLGACVARHRKV